MSKDENIKNNFRISLLHSIKHAHQKDNDIINIYLCDIDEPNIFAAYQELLEEIKANGGLTEYTLETPRKKIPDISKPSDLEIETDPVSLENYYENLQHYKEMEDEPYNSLKIKKGDVNIEAINKLLASTLASKVKIIVVDGKIIEENNKVLIHKYNTDTKAYIVADYLFNKANIGWVSYDEIIEYCEGVSDNDVDSTKNQKQIIADAVKNVNKHALAKLGYKIIENNGKTEYKALK